MTSDFNLFEIRLDNAGGPFAQMMSTLVALSEQSERWRADLSRAQTQMETLVAGSGPDSHLKLPGPARVTAHQLVSFVNNDLLTQPSGRISYARPSGGGILKSKEAFEAIQANPKVTVRELVTRPKRVPRAAPPERVRVRATWSELPEIAIIDDAVALFPTLVAGGDVEIAVVRQPFVVRLLTQFFEAAWAQGASTLEQGLARDLAEAELKQRIILMLSEGAKDETVARTLGISLRTCRRHVAEVLDELASSSRFQAGVRAAQLGRIPVRLLGARP